LLASTTTASTNTWQRASVSFAVAGGAPAAAQLPITLLFDIADAADSFGAYIDNVILLPLEVVELSPKTKDEDGNEIAGSEKPNIGNPLTPFVEIDPNANKIAHREIKVLIGSLMKDKKVTWSLEPVPGATPAAIRGKLSNSPVAAHKNCFEESSAYGKNGFVLSGTGINAKGETTVGADGHTAIRVNVPAIGFNQARIKIQIEGMSTPMDLIDMEVPGVVVIDPGHGGDEKTTMKSSSWNNAESPSGVLEKTMALDYGLSLRDTLRTKRQKDKLNLRIFMTRQSDVNLSGPKRANLARDNGADIIFIIHFNSDDITEKGHTPHRSRGTLQVVQHNNKNPTEDAECANTIIGRMVTAFRLFDTQSNQRAAVNTPTDAADDVYLGNTDNYHPIRAPYCEVEFIDYGADTPNDVSDDAVDILMNTGPNAAAVKSAVTNAMRDGILQDLRDQPKP
jgi:N-acetylmuramoyl-L-alanine amidase